LDLLIYVPMIPRDEASNTGAEGRSRSFDVVSDPNPQSKQPATERGCGVKANCICWSMAKTGMFVSPSCRQLVESEMQELILENVMFPKVIGCSLEPAFSVSRKAAWRQCLFAFVCFAFLPVPAGVRGMAGQGFFVVYKLVRPHLHHLCPLFSSTNQIHYTGITLQ